jgi:alpha-aminoadipate/glutamate carrier protein LysW
MRLNPATAVYNTMEGVIPMMGIRQFKSKSEGAVVLRCPECSAEIDVDEDEVEEGEILSCPECESELEVSQTHPVALNPISDDLDDDDDDEEEDDDEDDEEEDDEEEEDIPEEDGEEEPVEDEEE